MDNKNSGDTDENKDDISNVMGFGSFGGGKKAKQFDFMAMFEQTRQTAMDRSQKVLEDRVKDTKIDDRPHSSGNTIKGPMPLKNKQTDSESEDDDDDVIGPPIPGSMKTSVKEDEDEIIGPPIPTAAAANDDDDEDEPEEEDEVPWNKIPSSHEIELRHGSKTVSALTLDPSGARLVTGGYDYDMKFWDFAGMDSSLRSFRNLRPCQSHPIRSLAYNASGEYILIVAGNSQAKVITRDGHDVMECPKGDQYMNDMAKTKGHIAMLNGGCWNPKNRHEFITCSNDGSVRIWDTTCDKKHKNIMKPRSKLGRKATPTACVYSTDGKLIATACQDGSIHVFENKKYIVGNPAMLTRGAHQEGSDVSGMAFSYDGTTLATRGGDDTVKLWDIRNFKKPINVAEGLTNYFPVTDVIFSPDDKMVITGVSVKKNEGKGKLVFMERNTLQVVREMTVSDSSVVRCLWHPKLNQIVCGCSDGVAKLYYDPDKSVRGAKLCVFKKKKREEGSDFISSTHIITPHALPMFRTDREKSTWKQDLKARMDPAKSKRPDLPVSGPGQGGRIAAKGGTLSQYIAQSIAKSVPDDRDKDPRAAILRHAEAAESDPYWITPAYKKDQPYATFQKEEEEEEENDGPLWKKPKLK